MNSKVKTSPLNEFITLQRGFDLPSKDRIEGNIPVVASTGIGGYHNEFKVKAPGVVIGRSGSIGGGQYVEEDFWPLNTTLWVKDFKGHNPRYVYYLLRSIDFSRFNVGTGVPTLNRNHLSSIKVVVLDREDEDRVAETLGILDDKIQLNLQINQTLEQIAQAVFQSWFIDFDPVRAKATVLEEGGSQEEALLAAMQVISSKSLEELKAFQGQNPSEYDELRRTAKLFPRALVDSEFGEIPQGWGVSTLGEEFDVIMGQSPPGHTYNEKGEGVPFFQGRRDFGERFSSKRVYCTEPKRMAKEGDTLLSVRAPVGDVNKALFECCIGRGLAAIRHHTGCTSFTYYSLLQLGRVFSTYDSEGTVFGSINQRDLKAISILAPTPEVLSAFSKTVGSLDALIKTNTVESEVLERIRNTLMPKLLSGELKLHESVDKENGNSHD